MFQGHFKHTGGSILLCLLLYTFFAWFYNCHRDTVVIILVYQVDSRQVSPASVTSSRFHTSPTLPKAHSHLRGLPAEDGFFGVRGWWVSEIQGTATVAWCCLMFDYFRMNSLNISEPSIHFDSLHSLLSHPTWTHLLLDVTSDTLYTPSLSGFVSERGTRKYQKKAIFIGESDTGLWWFWWIDGFWGTKFWDNPQYYRRYALDPLGKIYPWAWIAWEEIRGNSLPGWIRS